MNEHNCRVCDLYIENLPWGEDGETPTYEICDCCGVEFGYEDCTVESANIYSEKWIVKGCISFSPSKKPKDWNMQEQIKNIPIEYE